MFGVTARLLIGMEIILARRIEWRNLYIKYVNKNLKVVENLYFFKHKGIVLLLGFFGIFS